MKYDLDTNVTVITLPINTTADVPCRYINNRGEFDFQSRDMNLVRREAAAGWAMLSLWSAGSGHLERG